MIRFQDTTSTIQLATHQALTTAPWLSRYSALGIPAIPLLPNGKAPLCEGWQGRSPLEQWSEVHARGFRASASAPNVGILAGRGFVVLDADDEGAAQALDDALQGLGIYAPRVETATPGHAHYYVPVSDVPPDFRACLLAPGVGRGELRGRSNVVAPPSMIDGRLYRFARGAPENVVQMRPLRWQEVLALFGGGRTPLRGPPPPAALDGLTQPPVRLLKRAMPRKAAALLKWLKSAPKGQACELVEVGGELIAQSVPYRDDPAVFASRSEVEMSVICQLILTGYNLADVGAIFDEAQPGHYWACDADGRVEYLSLSYQRAVSHLASTGDRELIAALYADAEARPWPGQTGALKRLAYLAALSKAWQFGMLQVRVSTLEIAELAASDPKSVSRALGRLACDGLLRKVRDSVGVQATEWAICLPAEGEIFRGSQSSQHSKSFPTVTICGILGNSAAGVLLEVSSEVWGRAALGRSAELVLRALLQGFSTPAEVKAATGKALSTVYAALEKLAAHGLAVREGKVWRAADDLPEALARAAQQYDAQGRAQARRARHERQREAYRERIAGGAP